MLFEMTYMYNIYYTWDFPNNIIFTIYTSLVSMKYGNGGGAHFMALPKRRNFEFFKARNAR